MSSPAQLMVIIFDADEAGPDLPYGEIGEDYGEIGEDYSEMGGE